MSNIKISQVAKAAGVSVATVSRVINNKNNVKPETTQRVKEAIQAMDYHPNLLGSTLRQSSSRTVILVANTISKPFYVSFMDTIQRAAAKHDYKILLGQYGDNVDLFYSYVKLVQSRLADGLILVNHNRDMEYLEEIARKFPVIQCCEHTENSVIPYVTVDDYKCAQLAVEHLVAKGKREIAFFNYSLTSQFAKRCHEGFVDTIRKEGLTLHDGWIVNVPSMDFEPVYEAALKFLGTLCTEDRPDAIFAEVDIFGPAILKAAAKLGISVPQDLAVASGDNTFLCEATMPSLTAVDHRREQMAESVFELLLERIENAPVKHRSIVVEPSLIVREST